jgi:hypothetical protein
VRISPQILVGEPEEKRVSERLRRRWEDDIHWSTFGFHLTTFSIAQII